MIATWGDSKKPVFILPTDDQSSNIFVFEIGREKLTHKLLNTEFISIFGNILEDESEFSSDFAIKTKNVIKSLKDTK